MMSSKVHSRISIFGLIFFLTVSTIPTVSFASLKVGYYRRSCPSAEAVVRNVVEEVVSKDPGLAGALIRMHFHDCFVKGCDASILLDSTPNSPSEKEHPANNPSLRGYEVIDEAKAKLEALCPNTVSCADIVAFAARDSTYKVGNIRYSVQSGRRDGRVSLKDEPSEHLPPPFFNVTQLQQNFERKGLSLDEMVTLSGSHSVGVSHCSSFSNRLYSFNSTHRQDPSLHPSYARQLRKRCPPSSSKRDPTVPLDANTPFRLDNKYYKNLKKHRGLLESDQTLMSSYSTAKMVMQNKKYETQWANKFAAAMVHMGSIDVLTGNMGEIRKNCRVVNY